MKLSFFLLMFSACFLAVMCIPPLTPEEYARKLVGLKIQPDVQLAATNFTMSRDRRASFKYLYVDSSGGIHSSRGSNMIEVAATYSVSGTAHHTAAVTIGRMTYGMPGHIFSSVATNTRVGVFTRAESLCVYPEYYRLCNGGCGCSCPCSGSCASTCTSDNRKYSSLAGTGGQRGVVVDHNVLCDGSDTYQHKSNILVHEYAHTIKLYGLPAEYKPRITAAYNNARANRIWTSQYAMVSEEEYWAESTSAFFNAEHLKATSGGMNHCSYGLCRTENEVRWNIYNKDRQLYNLLVEVYTNSRPGLASNLAPCTTGTAVGK